MHFSVKSVAHKKFFATFVIKLTPTNEFKFAKIAILEIYFSVESGFYEKIFSPFPPL